MLPLPCLKLRPCQIVLFLLRCRRYRVHNLAVAEPPKRSKASSIRCLQIEHHCVLIEQRNSPVWRQLEGPGSFLSIHHNEALVLLRKCLLRLKTAIILRHHPHSIAGIHSVSAVVAHLVPPSLQAYKRHHPKIRVIFLLRLPNFLRDLISIILLLMGERRIYDAQTR